LIASLTIPPSAGTLQLQRITTPEAVGATFMVLKQALKMGALKSPLQPGCL
jgi:hypothetical protein